MRSETLTAGSPEGREIIRPANFRPPGGGADLPRLHLPWAAAGVAAILLACVWATVFVLTARSVRITAEPPQATIAVDEWPAPYLNGYWLLRPGPRRLRVEAPGYLPFRADLEVTTAASQAQTIKLQPLPGHLAIHLAPVDRAAVVIDGKQTGTAPSTLRDLAAGRHEIKITAARYLTYTGVLDIEGRGIEQTLEVELHPAWATATFSSRPEGAEVLIGKTVAGTTPLTTEVLQGNREIRVRKPGYKEWQRSLEFVAGKTINLPEILLSKADGEVQLTTRPAGASVTVDGAFKGQTPLQLALAPDTAHEFAVFIDGYATEKRTLSVASGHRETLDLALTPELATVRLVTTPEDAELLLDGQPQGTANQTLSLPTRDHEIIVRKAGYATYRSIVTPRKGVDKQYKIRLKTAAEMAREVATTRASAASDGTVTTAIGQQLKLFTGGEAMLGTARGAPASRDNETLRKVVLRRPFYLGVKEVSNAEYRRFLGHYRVPPEKSHGTNDDDQPVVNLTWEAAALFCNWLSRRDSLPVFYQIRNGRVLGINPDATGYRLPTESEWEWAARTPPKGDAYTFPWGEKYPPRARSGNYADESAAGLVASVVPDYNDGYAVSAPTGSFAPNPRGLHDLGGNVAEWVHDYYEIPAAAGTILVDPLGPPQGENHVIRGSSWAHATLPELRLAFRDYGVKPRMDLGFRLARYAQ